MTREASERIDGLVREVIFENEDTGYKVLEIETAEGDLATLVGTLPGVRAGETIQAAGFWDEHSTYGEQFRVCSFSHALPQGAAAMERYLASGAVKGVGEALAHRIVEKFGERTFEILEREPERLAEVKGIGLSAACSIGEQFAAGRDMRDVLMFLQEYGISAAYAVEIYREFGARTVETVKNDPYVLAERVRGIGFLRADEIAAKMGIPRNSEGRLRAAVRYLLQEAAAQGGHTYLPQPLLEDRLYELTGIEGTEAENILVSMAMDGKLIIKNPPEQDPQIFLTYLFRAEAGAAARLTELARTKRLTAIGDKELAAAQKKQRITLSEEQLSAVKAALTEGVLVITGGPGTGKTTIINLLLELLRLQKEEYLLAAPTGRAAKRMQELTGEEAQTIHRLLEVKAGPGSFGDGERQLFARDQDHPLEADVIIVDELSMVDAPLFSALLRAIAPGTRLILVGDKDQLPSVGAGNVLQDILASGQIRSVRLTEIYRQGKLSDIVLNAHRVNEGQYPEFNRKDTDFFLVRCRERGAAVQTVIDLVRTRMPKFAGVSPWEIQVMSPQHKGDLGVDNLNRVLQQTLNPPAKSKAELGFRDTLFREGDRVMQVKNDYELEWCVRNEYGKSVSDGAGVFNGDLGRVKSVSPSGRTLTVLFDDKREAEYDFPELEELCLAYAITIHKSQGSQSPVVVLPLLSGPGPLYCRNLLYTAITRAQRYVVVVGSEDTVRRMVDNDRTGERFTSLAEQLRRRTKLLEE